MLWHHKAEKHCNPEFSSILSQTAFVISYLHEMESNVDRVVNTQTNTEDQVDAWHCIDGESPPGHQGHHINL